MQEKHKEYTMKREIAYQRKANMEQEIEKRSIDFINDLDKKFMATSLNKSISLKQIKTTAKLSNMKADNKM